jgi:hypothetical protein
MHLIASELLAAMLHCSTLAFNYGNLCKVFLTQLAHTALPSQRHTRLPVEDMLLVAASTLLKKKTNTPPFVSTQKIN